MKFIQKGYYKQPIRIRDRRSLPSSLSTDPGLRLLACSAYYKGRLMELILCPGSRPNNGSYKITTEDGTNPDDLRENKDESGTTIWTQTLIIEYIPSPEDLDYVAKCDQIYLNSLLWGTWTAQEHPTIIPKSTTLQKTEAGVWLLWTRYGCPNNIGFWYMAQLKRPNIRELVEQAERECKEWSPEEKSQYEQAARIVQATEAKLTKSLPTPNSCIEIATTTTISTQYNLPAELIHHPITGDGDCFYNAVEYYLCHGENVASLRKVVADSLAGNIQRHQEMTPLRDHQSLQNYITNIARLRMECGEEIQINILIELLERPIVIIGPEGCIRNIEIVKRYSQKKPIFVFSNPGDRQGDSQSRHYDCLLLRDGYNGIAVLTKMLASSYSFVLADIPPPKEETTTTDVSQTCSGSLVTETDYSTFKTKITAELRKKLATLVVNLTKLLNVLQEKEQLLLLLQEEQSIIQKLKIDLPNITPQTLNEAELIKAINELEKFQHLLNTLLAEQETRKKIIDLRNKLHSLLETIFKSLNFIDERKEIILLPRDEGQDLQDFISHIKSLVLDTLDETSLNSEIALLESKQKDLKSVQKRIAILAKERAEKVAKIEAKIRKFNLKVKASKLAGDRKGIIENYVFIQDCYSKIAALGIDRSRELAEIDRKIKEIQGKLHPTPSPIPPSPTIPLDPQITEAFKCLIIPYAEIQLVRKLGAGAFGTVHLGLWRTENIAIKVLHSAQLTDNSKKAFLSEVDIMRKLVSERLVRLSGVCVAPDPYCIVMEYLPRGSLYSLLHSEEQYSWEVSLQIAIDIGNGLAFLQEAKIIHRDLKSLNVLLDTQYRAKICDFGLSKLRQEVSVTSTRPIVVGTNAWNAPELFGLRPKYSFASDIYAYGMILWEILTRETPYKDVLDPNEIKSAVKNGEREEIPATCSATYRDTIERCWAQKPEERPQALQVTHALQIELDTVKLKSWHIEPKLIPTTRNEDGFHLIPANDYDIRKVVEAYQRFPVPRMEIGRVTIIFNPLLEKSFADGIELLERRFSNSAFAATWSTDGDASIMAWRAEIIRRFEAIANAYQDPANKHVKILPVWHGTKADIINSIARTGYANLATTDTGFFGQGLYSTYEAAYAYRVYGPGKYGSQGTLLVNWIACFSAYPVVGYKVPGYTGIVEDPGDMLRLQGKGNFGNYDAHFVPVRPRTIDPNEGSYYPCRPNERATYHEIVVFDKTLMLPRYIVELQPSLVVSPPMAPLLTATGMFVGKTERQDTATPTHINPIL